MKPVKHEEFYKFIDNYPNKLEVDVSHICDPPLKTWNDFSLGNWPESIVAKCKVFDNDPYYTKHEKDYVNNGKWLENAWSIEE